MLQSPVSPTSYSLRIRRKAERDDSFEDEERQSPEAMADTYDDDNDDGSAGEKGRGKSRRELPTGAVSTLKAWLLSPEHFTHPYPSPQDQAMLMQKTGIDKKQLKNWFTNARRRIWKPLLKKQIESGKLSATGVPGTVQGLILPSGLGAASSSMDNPHSMQAMRVHYQQVQQQQDQTQQVCSRKVDSSRSCFLHVETNVCLRCSS
jgi:Homeobox KN domain